MNKIIIGSANFGLNYGVNNASGKLPVEEIINILITAQDHGINYVDTAQAYGDSEERIGNVLNELDYPFNLVTKFKLDNKNSLESSLEKSFQKLKVKQIYGILYHDFSDYRLKPNSLKTLLRYREMGAVKKIGYSLYYPSELEFLLNKNIDFNMVQVPFSIFDRRFAYLFPRLKELGIEIQTRSVFLQGQVFKNPYEFSKEFEEAKDKLIELINISKRIKQSVASVCLNFVTSNDYIDKVVIGVDDAQQLKVNIDDMNYEELISCNLELLNELLITDENIILPFNWKS